ncbi:MAG: T9SS type A sorting domain-containing protein [Flavobacteriaceae bacterium]|nr:T9SS type A sorting domain-containing protein [Flavobacteriaceae bacterium]
MTRLFFILLFTSLEIFSQVVSVEDRKIFVDGDEYRINGICYARGEGNGETSGFSYTDDIPLLVEANVNTVRTYSSMTDVNELNAFAEAGIKIIMHLNENSYTWYVNQYKDHPAILMWEFGNEFNYHPEWFGGNIDNWYDLLETAAENVKTIDPNHPVSTGNGEVPSLEVINSCPSVDVWGMNIYRFLNTVSAITELASYSDKAMYISESGADSYNNNSQSDNESQQALATEHILNTVLSYSNLCAGITLFEFCDEWWKAGDPSSHDSGGFAVSVAYDNFANEEYWGIVNRDRTKKESFYVVQEIYGNQGGNGTNEDLITFLESGTWRLQTEVSGYRGVGPGDSFSAEWWNSSANEDASTNGLYDDRFNFYGTSISGQSILEIDTGDDGSIMGKKPEIDAAFDPTNSNNYTADNEFNEYYSYPKSDYSDSFVLSNEGETTETITFDSNGGLGFYTALNNQQYQVLDRTETTMYLRNVGSEGNSWYGKFTTDVLSNPEVEQLEMILFPNPVNTDYVTIKTFLRGIKYVEIFDINGRLVLKQSLDSELLNISQFNAGLFFVKVTMDGKSSTSKLVVY